MASSAPDHLRTPGLISNRPCYEGIKVAHTLKGFTPHMLTTAPDGNVWVQESGSNSNAVFDPVSLDIVKRIPAGKGPVVGVL